MRLDEQARNSVQRWAIWKDETIAVQNQIENNSELRNIAATFKAILNSGMVLDDQVGELIAWMDLIEDAWRKSLKYLTTGDVKADCDLVEEVRGEANRVIKECAAVRSCLNLKSQSPDAIIY